MALEIFDASLTAEQQVSIKHCGPAAIRMILSRFGSLVSQNTLWTEVKNKSAGGTKVPANGSLVLEFPRQVCHDCGEWFCWFTTPEAMARTIAGRVPSWLTAWAAYPATQDAALVWLIRSLARAPRFPAAATIFSSNHWVVISGYHINNPKLPSVPIGPYAVNGIHVMDPFDDVPTATMMTVEDWNDCIKSLDCGPQKDAYPIVVGGLKTGIVYSWMRLMPRAWRLGDTWRRPRPNRNPL